MKNEQIASISYAVDRAIRSHLGQELPEWSKQEALYKQDWRSKVATLRGKDKITPQVRHETWVQDMVTAGWKQGKIVDSDAKEHPSICAYDILPTEVHLLDGAFSAVGEAASEISPEA